MEVINQHSFTKLWILLLLLFSVTSFGQIKQNSYLLTLNLGFVPLTNGDSGNNITAYNVSSTFEQLLDDTNLAVGLNASFMTGEDTYTKDQQDRIVTLSTTSFLLTAKYFFGSGKIIPYAGFGVGIHNSSIKGTYAGVGTSGSIYETLNGVSFDLPLGINFYFNEEVFVGINVVGMFLENSKYENDLNYMVNLGVGFQF